MLIIHWRPRVTRQTEVNEVLCADMNYNNLQDAPTISNTVNEFLDGISKTGSNRARDLAGKQQPPLSVTTLGQDNSSLNNQTRSLSDQTSVSSKSGSQAQTSATSVTLPSISSIPTGCNNLASEKTMWLGRCNNNQGWTFDKMPITSKDIDAFVLEKASKLLDSLAELDQETTLAVNRHVDALRQKLLAIHARRSRMSKLSLKRSVANVSFVTERSESAVADHSPDYTWNFGGIQPSNLLSVEDYIAPHYKPQPSISSAPLRIRPPPAVPRSQLRPPLEQPVNESAMTASYALKPSGKRPISYERDAEALARAAVAKSVQSPTNVPTEPRSDVASGSAVSDTRKPHARTGSAIHFPPILQHRQTSSQYNPTSPQYSPTSPRYTPASPLYNPTSPGYTSDPDKSWPIQPFFKKRTSTLTSQSPANSTWTIQNKTFRERQRARAETETRKGRRERESKETELASKPLADDGYPSKSSGQDNSSFTWPQQEHSPDTHQGLSTQKSMFDPHLEIVNFQSRGPGSASQPLDNQIQDPSVAQEDDKFTYMQRTSANSSNQATSHDQAHNTGASPNFSRDPTVAHHPSEYMSFVDSDRNSDGHVQRRELPGSAVTALTTLMYPRVHPASYEKADAYWQYNTPVLPTVDEHTTPSSPRTGQKITHKRPRPKPQCWEHGCNGREFTTFSNLLRHQRERSGTAPPSYCPHCGEDLGGSTARTYHLLQSKCKPHTTSRSGSRGRGALIPIGGRRMMGTPRSSGLRPMTSTSSGPPRSVPRFKARPRAEALTEPVPISEQGRASSADNADEAATASIENKISNATAFGSATQHRTTLPPPQHDGEHKESRVQDFYKSPGKSQQTLDLACEQPCDTDNNLTSTLTNQVVSEGKKKKSAKPSYRPDFDLGAWADEMEDAPMPPQTQVLDPEAPEFVPEHLSPLHITALTEHLIERLSKRWNASTEHVQDPD